MTIVRRKLSNTFQDFFDSEKSSGVLLIVCTVVSLLLANSAIGARYLSSWQIHLGGLSVEHWINDGLMALFFLLIGLELKRELYSGELSNFKNAMLPVFAAIGGICVPASIHYALNSGTPAQLGIGIPVATDIAFALGVLALFGPPRSCFTKSFSYRTRRNRRFGCDHHYRCLLHGTSFQSAI